MKKYLLIASLIILYSCQDVISLEVPDSVNSIVISGRVTDEEPAMVIISRTAPYFAQGRTPRISNAQVWILEDGDTVSALSETAEAGVYTSSFKGTIGHSYEVLVKIEDNAVFRNSIWRSYPETMQRVYTIDSLSIRRLNRKTVPQAFEPGYYALMYFGEPQGLGDFYRMRRWRNDSLFDQDIFVFGDANFDGAYFGKGGDFPGFTFYGPFKEEGNDTIRVEISSISEEYYHYLSLINEQVFQVGSTFDPPPQTIIGNIYNASKPEEYGFGYFGASALSTDEIAFTP